MKYQDAEQLFTGERLETIRRVISNRQEDFTLILENVHDPHNIGAVLRTAESVGLHEIYALYTIESVDKIKKIAGHKSSSGAKKWLDIHLFTDTEKCFTEVRRKYRNIYAAYLSEDSQSLYDLDLNGPVALLFGNEHRGVSPEALAASDGSFVIPQYGFTESLNISVACAVSLYEGLRQRRENGKYGNAFDIQKPFQKSLYIKYLEKSRPKVFGRDKIE